MQGGVPPEVYAGIQSGDAGNPDVPTAGAGTAAAEDDSKVLKDAGFQKFAEFVLERTLLSLLQESVAGDWPAPANSE
jgi:hypothetical protein